MKLLILACASEAGQTDAAKALREEAARQGHEALIRDPFAWLEKRGDGEEKKRRKSAFSRRVERMADATPLTAPFLFSNAKYAESFLREVREEGYGAILAIHPYAMEAVSATVRRGETLPPAYGVFTDYALPAIFRAAELTGYFLPHWTMTEDLAAKGILREKLIPVGVPASRRLSEPMEKEAARNFLVLPRDLGFYLIFAEGMSAGNVSRILDEILARAPEKTLVTVMAGRQSEERDELAARYAGESRVQVSATPERIDVYLSAGDVLIMRPDGFLASEAALAGIPTVLYPALPGTVDAKNADFFAAREMALKAQSARDAARKAERLVLDRAQRERIEVMQKRGSVRAAAGEIIREAAAERGKSE
ncbi:MAG: hypothetical protein IJM21_05105 [Clostridia bacterium]|nr:hypothetical protein [Clostridia bacterium]